MDATFHVGYGQDLNVTVELVDADMSQATTLLGQACNELLRLNMALVMQEADQGSEPC
jgi:hypothetical protein